MVGFDRLESCVAVEVNFTDGMLLAKDAIIGSLIPAVDKGVAFRNTRLGVPFDDDISNRPKLLKVGLKLLLKCRNWHSANENS